MSDTVQKKDRWLRARADKNLSNLVDDYLAQVGELNSAQLIRKAVKEYIQNHPVKKDHQTQPLLTKPGA